MLIDADSLLAQLQALQVVQVSVQFLLVPGDQPLGKWLHCRLTSHLILFCKTRYALVKGDGLNPISQNISLYFVQSPDVMGLSFIFMPH